tara:strand:- start:545 stop:766 length:222 start_codon:yes stop_codon:yes gene_type:complete
MKKINLAIKLMLGLIVFYLIYNTIFGWNSEPINEYEKGCDIVAKLWYKICIFLYLLPVLDLYEDLVKKLDERK